MQALHNVAPNGYIVAIDSDSEAEYYVVSLDIVKSTLKQPPTNRVSFIRTHGSVLPTSAMHGCDLWIDATLCSSKFWSSQGESDWRDFLIDETK